MSKFDWLSEEEAKHRLLRLERVVFALLDFLELRTQEKIDLNDNCQVFGEIRFRYLDVFEKFYAPLSESKRRAFERKPPLRFIEA